RVRDHDPGALVRQQSDGLTTDAGSSSGHNRNLALESHSVHPLLASRSHAMSVAASAKNESTPWAMDTWSNLISSELRISSWYTSRPPAGVRLSIGEPISWIRSTYSAGDRRPAGSTSSAATDCADAGFGGTPRE